MPFAHARCSSCCLLVAYFRAAHMSSFGASRMLHFYRILQCARAARAIWDCSFSRKPAESLRSSRGSPAQLQVRELIALELCAPTLKYSYTESHITFMVVKTSF